MYCALERPDSAQFLSHAARTHTLPFPRTRSNNTHKHTSTLWTPSFSFFPPLVYLPLFACLVLFFLDCLLSICSSDPLEAPAMSRCCSLLSCPNGHPTPLRANQTCCLTEGINHPCLHNWPGRPLSTRPGAGAGANRYCRHRRQSVVGVKMMEWNSTFQKSQSSSACYSSCSRGIIIFQTVFYLKVKISLSFGKNCTTLQPELI